MNSSIQTRHAVVLLAALMLASVRSASAQSLTIQSASVNAAQTILSISGTNYCATPTVTLGGTALSVQSSTPALITANLPALAPGTYYLIVSCGTLAGRTVYFNVTIGARPLQRAAAGAPASDMPTAETGRSPTR